MYLSKIFTALYLCFFASVLTIQAMDYDPFYGNIDDSMTIRSVVDRISKKTTIYIDNVNGGVMNFRGKTMSENSEEVGVHLSGLNSFGKILVFFKICKNGKVFLMESCLATEKNIDETFDINAHMNITDHSIILTGNEDWDHSDLNFDKTSVQSTGLQRITIELKHAAK